MNYATPAKELEVLIRKYSEEEEKYSHFSKIDCWDIVYLGHPSVLESRDIRAQPDRLSI